jgi:hypothetical protein
MRRAPILTATTVAGALLAAPAAGEVAPVRLLFAAEPGCLEEATFLAGLRAQTANLRRAPAGQPARRIVLSVEPGDGRFVGVLRVEEIDGASSVRQVEGASCAEVATALVLVTAVAIDAGPLAASRPPSPPPPLTPAALEEPPPPPPALPPPPPRLSAGVQAGVSSALAPAAAWGIAPFLDWSAWGRSGLAPSLRLQAHVRGASAAIGGGTAAFRLLGGSFSGCPLALRAGPLTARPCAGIEAGAVRAEGSGLPRGFVSTRPWAAATLAGRAQIALVPRLFVEVEAALFAPFVRDRYVFDSPRVEVHAVPALGASGAVGLGATFF